MSRIEGLRQRRRIELAGAVQGVGFRPFVYRLARELNLDGWARNALRGLEMEVEGSARALDRFQSRMRRELPPHATISSIRARRLPIEGKSGFRIDTSSLSEPEGAGTEIVPDIATCPDCLEEILDPANRRFAYPFTNCAHCGPRFSIVLESPYDRERTTMRAFEMCEHCREEYETPEDRRFHAQPNACPDCGPQLSWRDANRGAEVRGACALETACRAIEDGSVIAVKGIGGFHLMVDASNLEAISALRRRKGRQNKPFALMFPTIDRARRFMEISEAESRLLLSTAAPIVLLNRKPDCSLPNILAPGNPALGIMLPYSPLHHLLLGRLGIPVVATSGNLSEEPICVANEEALSRLSGIVDGFLMHNRDIARPVDDSVARVFAGDINMLRRSRGYAPRPISAPDAQTPVLALGGDLKNTLAIAANGRVWLSQHLGDLGSLETRRAYEEQAFALPSLFGIRPKKIARDRHPGYASGNTPNPSGLRSVEVQHHYAHAVSCFAENAVDMRSPCLAVVWDGAGYGDDGTTWGGEFLLCQDFEYRRLAWLRPFRLPGGDKAARDPRFAALGCLRAAKIDVRGTPLEDRISTEEKTIAGQMLEQGINSPSCSSAGRLFDAVSALCGLCLGNSFEGEAASALEFAARRADKDLGPYPIDFQETGEIDWSPLLRAVVEDLRSESRSPERVAMRFHRSMSLLIGRVALASGCQTVALTGGCFQNALLLGDAVCQIDSHGKRPVWHKSIPANDGGLSFGQAVVASRAELHKD